MDADKIVKYAIADYNDGNINECEFVDRLRLIVSPNPIVLKCITSWDMMKHCINSVEDNFRVLHDMPSIEGDIR